MLQNNGISEKKNEHVFQIYYQKSARNFMPFINPLELCRVDSVLVNYHAQAPVCGLYKPPSISPVLMFPNGQEKIKGNSGIHSCNSQINKCKLHFPRNDFVI